MVQGPSPEIITSIRNPTSLDAQIDSLKQLKNDIVGHDQRKELVVKQGVLDPLVEILAAPAKTNGKRSSSNGVSLQQTPSGWTQEDEARLQATLILGSIASGGLAFVKPLIASRAPRYLLDALSTEVAPRIITATLQALRSLAVSASHGNENDESSAAHPIETFQTLLKQPSTSATSRQQQKLSAEIIALSAEDDPSRALLANSGILDTLASLLVSHTVSKKYIGYIGSTASLPPPPADSILPSILTAISSIIKGSNFRAQCFILSSPIRGLFASTDGRLTFGASNGSQGPMENLLPPLHVPIYKSVSFNAASSSFPALGSLQPGERRAGGALDSAEYGGTAEHANQVISWLVFLARSMKGLDRLAALRLLALVNSAIEADALLVVPRTESLQRGRERERQLAMLAVPLAVKLVQSASEDKNTETLSTTEERENNQVQEQACEVLALLIQGSKELQAAAVEAGAIKRVCPILKQTFDSVTIAKPMWNAKPTSNDQTDVPESCRLGPRGLPPEIRHAMLCRRSALEAIAALAKKEDLHRKAIVEAGVVSCIIDSLKPFDVGVTSSRSRTTAPPTPKAGNTTPVILAACHAAQSMSRSVSLLRTSLIDAGIANPVFELLRHSSPEVQIAATDVCCNLLLEFSPMREDLLQAGAITTLTEHARQAEMGLRLASLWALKHLVLASSKDIKMQCLEELGAGWLVGAIQGEHREAALDLSTTSTGGVSVIAGGGLSTPNAAGEQVELLNPSTSMDVDEPGDEDEGVEEEEDEDGEVMYDEAVGTHYQASQLRSTLQLPTSTNLYKRPEGFSFARYLTSVRNLEQNPGLQAKRDDIAVQEQALDFVRNMLNGDDCAPMFEHLLRAIGQDKVFSLLSDKLAPVPTSAANSAARLNKPVYQPTELILSTVHVLTHIANGSPQHKQMLIAQKQLLNNWLPHFNHLDRRVRVISVWAVNSLTWVEDDADRAGAVQRAKELRLCGIEQAIRGLINDPDLDVRERVKTAVRQIEQL